MLSNAKQQLDIDAVLLCLVLLIDSNSGFIDFAFTHLNLCFCKRLTVVSLVTVSFAIVLQSSLGYSHLGETFDEQVIRQP
jgi:hypothetical protein